MKSSTSLLLLACAGLTASASAAPRLSASQSAPPATAPAPKKKPDFPSFADISKDFKKVVSTVDGKGSLYTLWTREKDGQMLAELPSDYARQKHYIALTNPTGEMFSGLQSGDYYVQWRRFDKRMALIVPNISERSTGDQESKDSTKTTHADSVLLDVPIVCMGPGGQPVIDMDGLLVGKASIFYRSANGANSKLATIVKAKAFPENIEIAYEMPVSGGKLKTYHYSISKITANPSYEPREADLRVGYFTTVFKDLGKFQRDDIWNRRINRWHLEKADTSLSMSPPKEAITFYLEHTVPIRYRRYVKEGVLAWNEAFEKIGITDAVVVHYQDKSTGAHMDKDPEDVRFNFVRWISNDIGTAIGPSRAHPLTGEILDADIVLTDGWIRAFWFQSNEGLPEISMEGFTAETMNWLDKHPSWDPRIRLAPPAVRDDLLAESERRRILGNVNYEHAFGDGTLLHDSHLHDEAMHVGDASMLCMASVSKAHDMAFMGAAFSALGLLDDTTEDGEKVEKIDGIPEWFLGPVLADLVTHEVGHTLGLRHNFKSSSIYTFEEMNSEEFVGKKTLAGSVMDYLPLNAVVEDGKLKGDHAMIGVGPYDDWAIEFGYGFGDRAEVLKRASEPELVYATDEDTMGPDPLARRYDLAAEPYEWVQNQMKLVEESRAQILTKFVKDGDSWSQARRGYEIGLRQQRGAVGVMANWLGGVFITRSTKGDDDNRNPHEVVSSEQQRTALKFVIENTFFDDAFGLTSELLSKMTRDKWSDQSGRGSSYQDSTYPIHEKISGIQATTLTQMLNPSTLRRIYDNELYVPETEDVLTLPELMQTIAGAVWQEVGYKPGEGIQIREASAKKRSAYTNRRPMISSLRRNLQREHLDRLIDLSLEKATSPSARSVSLLARHTLGEIAAAIDEAIGDSPDTYTQAHLSDAAARIQKAMDANFTYDDGKQSSGGMSFLGFRPAEQK
ncbi:MAG: hypothetical protein ACI835_003016 [Planctomycetota bacterium]|jgi:hypothetical protein